MDLLEMLAITSMDAYYHKENKKHGTVNIVNMLKDAEFPTYKPSDQVESMLLDQMNLTHKLIVGYIKKGQSSLTGSASDIKMAARLMNVFNHQVDTLKKYKRYGGPNFSFNTVNANQAIVGSVSTN